MYNIQTSQEWFILTKTVSIIINNMHNMYNIDLVKNFVIVWCVLIWYWNILVWIWILIWEQKR